MNPIPRKTQDEILAEMHRELEQERRTARRREGQAAAEARRDQELARRRASSGNVFRQTPKQARAEKKRRSWQRPQFEQRNPYDVEREAREAS